MGRPDELPLKSRIVMPLVTIGIGCLSVVGGYTGMTNVGVPVGVIGLFLLLKEVVPRSARKAVVTCSGLALMILAGLGFMQFIGQRTEVGGIVAVCMLLFVGVPGLILFILGLVMARSRP